jgi:EAL domain-containing protein (putative c-di-GMP-specific phosphodiesterase class I)
LLRRADMAMYHVKGEGKNGYAFYEASMLDTSYQKIVLEQNLRRALERDELEMYYQPQVDAATGIIVAAEALMRWHHPELGLLPAGEFLPFAEENGLMIPLTDWMLGAVCRDILAWKAAGTDIPLVALNISPHYLDRRDFFDKISGALTHYAIPASQIEVEITENICIRSPQHAIDQLNKLSQIGVSIAIDDFGTGYSSLSYLHRFPVHTIKIDKSFVRAIDSVSSHYPVVLAVISIARGLGLKVVAEGVETETQATYLRQNACSTLQGFLYYSPMPRSQFMRLIGQNQVLSA